MSDNSNQVLGESRYHQAKQEYFSTENVYCASHLRGHKALDTLVHHYLLDSERVVAETDSKLAARSVQLNQHETYELTDYLFRMLRDEEGRSVQDRYLDEMGADLSESAQILARNRLQTFPSLWQVTDVESSSAWLGVVNLLDGRQGQVLVGPSDQGLRRLHGLLFGDLVAVDEGLVPVGVVYLAQPGDRGFLLDAIARSELQARAAGLVSSQEEFLRWYEPAIRGAIRVLNGLRPEGVSSTYLPALGRADLGPRMAERFDRPFKVPADFKWPSPGVHFGGVKSAATGVETIHRYFLTDPGAWAKALSESPEFQLYRAGESFGWWYGGDGIEFFSERLNVEAEAHPILADIRFENTVQMSVRVFSPRIFKTLEPLLRKLAPKGQVLPKAVAEVQELGRRLPIYQTHAECRGYLVLAPKLGRRLSPEETAMVDEEWLITLIVQTHHRWAGGRTLDELAEIGAVSAIEDYLNQIEYLSVGNNYYNGVIAHLRQRFLAENSQG